MSILTHNPELKPILKGLKTGSISVTNALLSTVYSIIVDYAPPQRSKHFLQKIIGANVISFCCECGHPKLVRSMSRVFGNDTICPECLSTCYVQGTNGRYNHRLDYDPDSVPARINHLAEYNARVERQLAMRRTTQEKYRVAKQGFDNLAYLGVELEAEARTNCPGSSIVAKVMSALPDFVLCKSDSSLTNGMEIVSVPATYDIHKSGIWEPFFQENDGPAKFLRAWRTDTAGTHVHISRASFVGPVHMAKFLVFINSDDNANFVEKFAGRTSTRWAKRYKKKLTDVYHNSDKYEAVNFSTSAPTFEVRIFRGNISKAGVYRNLEFVQALQDFTRVTSMQTLTYVEWCTWLSDKINRKTYPYLYNWCIQNDYIRGKPVSTIMEDTTRGI